MLVMSSECFLNRNYISSGLNLQHVLKKASLPIEKSPSFENGIVFEICLQRS